MGVEGIKSMKSRKQNGRRAEGRYSKSVNMCRAIVKMVIKYLRTKWMAPDKCGGTFPEHCSGQVQ